MRKVELAQIQWKHPKVQKWQCRIASREAIEHAERHYLCRRKQELVGHRGRSIGSKPSRPNNGNGRFR
jgi:hypothetical protein